MKALVRPPSPSFIEALGQVDGVAIDLDLALTQHAAYAEALVRAGCEVVALPPDDALPDACFVEDTAVVLGGAALITCPGAPSRRPETSAVARALVDLELTHMDGGTLDGGDVLVLGKTVYVGLSARTNRKGVEVLADFARRHGYDIAPVNVPDGVLHLKCHASPLSPETLLCAPGWLTDVKAQRLEVHPDEVYAANVVAVGRSVLCAAGFPRTRDLLAEHGFAPVPLASSEFAKAAGSLTCLSILWGRATE